MAVMNHYFPKTLMRQAMLASLIRIAAVMSGGITIGARKQIRGILLYLTDDG